MTDETNIIEFRKVARGRPRFQWTAEVEEFIISGIVAGLTLRQIYDEGKTAFGGDGKFPSPTLIKVHLASNSDFQTMYMRAKDVQQDLMAEDLIDIVDGRYPGFETAELGQRKESAEIRKWVMGKLRRKKWGEVKVTEVTGADGKDLIPPQTIDPRKLSPEAKTALYQALQIATAQAEATDANIKEDEDE